MSARRKRMAGFTLIEALIATALMGAILTAIATVTAQWLPNWNRGMGNVQRTEAFALGLERLVADIAAAEFIPAGREFPNPVFEGTELSVTFVRSALGPNTRSGLELIRIGETGSDRGPVLVRTRARYAPVTAETVNDLPNFADPVILVRAPYRITFAYAGRDRVWRNTWRGESELPKAIRVQVRDGATDRLLSSSTAAIIHADMAADCVLAEVPADCIARPRTNAGGSNSMSEPGIDTRGERDGRGGFIVVAVLWILGALATLASIYAVYVIDTAVAFSVNDDRLQADGLFSASLELTAARYAAQPGVPASGQFAFRLGSANVTVDFRAENARIDLNTAPKALLAGLFTGLGTQPGLAETYAEGVVAWRTPPSPVNRSVITRIAGTTYPPRGGPFPHTGELALVPGLPELLVDRALPFVTVYSGAPQINIMAAAPEVLAALPGMTPGTLHAMLVQRTAEPQNVQRLAALLGPARPLAAEQGSKAVRVTPRIAFDNGQRMSADIVIFLLDNGSEPYRVLSWRDSSDDPATNERPGTRTR